MQGKITLITPPDIFENENQSILFISLSENDQEKVSEWFSKSDFKNNLNIYFYDKELDLSWLLHAVARCEHVFIDLDNLRYDMHLLNGYLLGKKHVVYKTVNENTAAICHYINQNRITNIEVFLERAING